MRGIVFDQPVEVARARQIRNRRSGVTEMQPVGFHRMLMAHRRAHFDVVDRIRTAALFHDFVARNEMPRIREEDRFALPRITRREQHAARLPAPLRHRFDHRVDIVGVVDVLVREHDRIQLRRTLRRNRAERPYERARSRIEVDLRSTEPHPHAARRANLFGDDETRAAGAEKADRDAHSPVNP